MLGPQVVSTTLRAGSVQEEHDALQLRRPDFVRRLPPRDNRLGRSTAPSPAPGTWFDLVLSKYVQILSTDAALHLKVARWDCRRIRARYLWQNRRRCKWQSVSGSC